MKTIKCIGVTLYIILCVFAIAISVLIVHYKNTINEEFTISKGSSIIINSLLPVTAEYNGVILENSNVINNVGGNFTVDLKLLGVIPVKSANVKVVDETFVAVLGTPFGIKMYTDGVLVTDISEIETANGSISPAAQAGIKIGDYILSVNEKEVKSNEEISEIILDSEGNELTFKLRRENEILTVKLFAVKSKDDNLYRAGIWVKDSSAGIGTLTFYSPQTNTVCGLGHAVYDKQSGNIIDFSNGQLVNASIVSIVKGTSGVAGELKGKLEYGKIADMTANTQNGIYGNLTCNIELNDLTEIAYSNEVKNGKAKILCTLDENGPQFYDCEIKIKENSVNNSSQNIVIEITDNELIKKTGGIVQGMSGAPIIQNGKLVGAVTHVLVDNPKKGYGIFAENMLKTAQSVAEERLKEAS